MCQVCEYIFICKLTFTSQGRRGPSGPADRRWLEPGHWNRLGGWGEGIMGLTIEVLRIKVFCETPSWGKDDARPAQDGGHDGY